MLDRSLREGEGPINRPVGGPGDAGRTHYPIRSRPTVRPFVRGGRPVVEGLFGSAHPSVMTLVNERRRKLLPTTRRLESAIAAPASIGLSMPSAARGIAARL